MGPLYPPRARKGAQGMAGCVAPVAILVVVPPCVPRRAGRRAPAARRARPVTRAHWIDGPRHAPFAFFLGSRSPIEMPFFTQRLPASLLLSMSLHRGATGTVRGTVEGARAHRRSFLTERMTGREWRSNPFYPPAFAWANEGPPVLRVSIRAPHREETKRKINFIHEDMPKRRTGRRRDDDATTTGTARPRWLRPQAAYKLEAAGEIQVLCARERRGGTCASCGAEHTLGLLTISYLSLLVALARGAESTKLRQSILSPPPPSS